MAFRAGSSVYRSVVVICSLLLAACFGLAQQPQNAPQQPQQTGPLLSPDQLDNLVAPIALYPDPLLSQVLAASTYPLEVVEAQQWVQHNTNLQGQQLMDAAKQQNWDPSVQALVALPDALHLLSSDVRWTTDLGNAFLAQQNDVMNAVQRMRARARSNGKLNSTQQQVVTTENQGGQSAIEIQPADPQVVYVPVYNPAYVWGPPAWGVYPSLWYPGFGFGFGFGPGIYIGSFFPGWGGWGGWGWGCGWFGGGLFLNVGFFNHYGFHGGFGGGFGRGFGGRNFGAGRVAWNHDPAHRMGVAYSNRAVASRFGQSQSRAVQSNRTTSNRTASSSRTSATGARSSSAGGGWQHMNGSNSAARAGSQAARGSSASASRGSTSSTYRGSNSSAYRGSSSSANSRSFRPAYSAPRQSSAAPRSYSASRSYSAPHTSSAPRSSGHGFSAGGGHSSSSGGHSGSPGGHSGGGGGGGGHHR